MFTRAYDVIMQALQTPITFSANTYGTTINDNLFTCKNYAGNIRNIAFAYLTSTGTGTSISNIYGYSLTPFMNMIAASNSNYASWIQIDETASAPSYEDYSCSNSMPTGWTDAGGNELSETIENGAHTITIKHSYKNNTNTLKTVYGIRVVGNSYYRANATSTSLSKDTFLLAREHFDAPIEVPAGGIIELALSWTTYRGGTSALSISA